MQRLKQTREKKPAGTLGADLGWLALAAAVFLGAGQAVVLLDARESRARAEALSIPAVEPAQAVAALESRGEEEACPENIPLTEREWLALVESCREGGIPLEIGLGLIWVESRFDRAAVNRESGCYGYCQLNPRYFPADLSPEENIRAGMGYLGALLERYEGDLEAALTAYHDGHDTGRRGYARAVLGAGEEGSTWRG